jgi:hypothetical protein
MPLLAHLELDAALLAAEAAVGFDELFRLAATLPSASRLVVEVRPKLLDEDIERNR